jgi:hypothetical protein
MLSLLAVAVAALIKPPVAGLAEPFKGGLLLQHLLLSARAGVVELLTMWPHLPAVYHTLAH